MPISLNTSLLGTILSVWAHPDDETYLAAGVMAAAVDGGQRVVCVSATAGELGTDDPTNWPPARLARVRQWEASAAMAVLGVTDHRILGLPDGDLEAHEDKGILLAGELIDEVHPDTILTFGAEGMTYHPDHIAVHRWVTQAWRARGRRQRLLYAATTVDQRARFGKAFEDAGVYMSDDRPPGVPLTDIALRVVLEGADLDRKVTALAAMASQTRPLIAQFGIDVYAEFNTEETFVAADPGDARGPG